ncbi:MAG: hypothetical protein H7199_07415 [Burkholderiales bacterium]|nr:hypothetical protein [Flavobacterium sp.]
MKNKIKLVLIASFTVGLMSSCVKEDFAAPVIADCVDSGLAKTKEVSEIYPLGINPSGNPSNSPTYTSDDIIEGYVISSDEGGNFYQSMYIQPTDGSKGFNLSAEVRNIYTTIEPGRKVFLKLKGLAFANSQAFAVGLIFGAPPTAQYAVDRLAALSVKNYLIPSCDVVSEETIVHKNLTIAQLTSNDTYLNTLVELDAVQFNDATAGGTYDTDRTDTSDSNTYITDGTNELAIRTSRYANFAGFKTPTGNGKIRGVVTKYNAGFQLVLRTERDVVMNNTRVISPSNPLGGTNIVFSGTLIEPFTTYNLDTTSFPNYINDQTVGGKYWKLKQYPAGTGNKYIEMSSYVGSSPAILAKSYFLVPVDFTAANTFTFKKEARYNAGAVLKVYYVKAADYVNGFISPSTFTDITTSFTITYPAIGASENSFTSAGTYNIPADLTGNGFFIFEYVGSKVPVVTTTMQLDDITIN